MSAVSWALFQVLHMSYNRPTKWVPWSHWTNGRTEAQRARCLAQGPRASEGATGIHVWHPSITCPPLCQLTRPTPAVLLSASWEGPLLTGLGTLPVGLTHHLPPTRRASRETSSILSAPLHFSSPPRSSALLAFGSHVCNGTARARLSVGPSLRWFYPPGPLHGLNTSIPAASLPGFSCFPYLLAMSPRQTLPHLTVPVGTSCP